MIQYAQVQECVSEFISFVTGEASDKCQREKRKTINGDDLLWAMTTLGFENYVLHLKSYLARYREAEGEKVAMSAASGNDKIGEAGGADIMHLASSDFDGVGLDMQIFGFYAAGPTSAVDTKDLAEVSGSKIVDFEMAREHW
jgi:Histone-like transcription factor (CBF/NF-Y) and archaeal histone